MVDSFVRADAAAVRLLHAGPDRQRGRARRGDARADAPTRSGTRWRATSAAAARTRRSRRRSARGETDPHRERGRGPVRGGLARRRGGRRSTSGPPGPREIVGRPATRVDGLERARGEAVYTADLQLPGCCTPPCSARRTRTRRCARIDLAPALALPGVHAAIGPGDIPQLVADAATRARRRRGVRRHARAGARGGRAIAVEWEVLEPLLDPDEAVARASRCSARRAGARAATSSAGSPRPTWSSRASTARRSSSTTRWRRTSRSCSGSVTRSRCTSRRSTSGASAPRVATRLGLPADKVRVVCNYMGGGFGSKNEPGRLHVHRGRARAAHRTGRCKCALSRREENLAAGNRNATIQRLTVGAAATAR